MEGSERGTNSNLSKGTNSNLSGGINSNLSEEISSNLSEGTNSNISEFSLAGEKLKLDSPADVTEYVKTLESAENLELVDLSGNTLGFAACAAIAAALEKHDTLKKVYLNDCFTGRMKEEVPPAIEAFGKVLANKPSLLFVDFSDNAFSPAGAKALSYFLSNCTSLQELRLNNNGLGPEGGQIIAESLCNAALKSRSSNNKPNLRRLSIGRNRLENGSSEKFAEAFKTIEYLEEVSMYQNGIRPEGIVNLVKGLSQCRGLKMLDLQDNTFDDLGSQAVAKALKNWPELVKLNIGDCYVGNKGTRSILASLAETSIHNNLEYLNLHYAEFKESTAKFLAEKLSLFPKLSCLMINGNCFDPEGVAANNIRKVLASMGKSEILDELDEMDVEEEESEEEIEEEESEKEIKEEEYEKEIKEGEAEEIEAKEAEQERIIDSMVRDLEKTFLNTPSSETVITEQSVELSDSDNHKVTQAQKLK